MKTLCYGLLCHALFLSGTVAFEFEEEIRSFLDRYCLECHGGEKVKGKVDFSEMRSDADAEARYELWELVAEMLEHEEMPPEDEMQPAGEEREMILEWVERRFGAPVEANPGFFQPRRLSASEYRNTLRSLFGFDLEVSIAESEQTVIEKSLVMKLLPTDAPGASGFVNDTHGAPLSTVLWDQYSYLADAALEELFSERRREALGAMIGEDLPVDIGGGEFTKAQAEALVRDFVPRAFRRAVPEERLEEMLEAFDGNEGEALIATVKTELKVVLMSPAFLYRGLLMEGNGDGQQAVDDFELAERLSYFLWEDMPDAELLEAAMSGRLREAEVWGGQVDRMLASPRARSLAESFGVQWLSLDEIDDTSGDPTRRHALKSQPIDFLEYLFVEDRPVMELIDSKTAFASNLTASYYGKDSGQMEKYVKPKGIERQAVPNQRITLEHAEGRGGILTMPGVLAMNKGPILRGTWMLRRILGEHLGEPPADVPPIKATVPGQNLTFRERFEQHRSDATCAHCHDKIDPLGFAMQAYNEQGQYRADSDAGKGKGKQGGKEKVREKIDTSGQLPSGERFADFAGLKEILLTGQREVIIRNVVERILSYALCRKLERHDGPAVDLISEKLLEGEGTWGLLVHEVANSLPFHETVLERHKDS